MDFQFDDFEGLFVFIGSLNVNRKIPEFFGDFVVAGE